MRIWLNTTFNPFYYAYYVYGLGHYFGLNQIRWTWNRLPDFGPQYLSWYDHTNRRRFVIDANDHEEFCLPALEWSHVYAKVNVAPGAILPEHRRKIKVIGPGFGIRYLPAVISLSGLIRLANQVGAHSELYRMISRCHFWHLFNRLPLNAFRPGPALENYIFLAASVWAPSDACNTYRRNFIQVCRDLDSIHFDGGFVPPGREDTPELAALMLARAYSLREYLRKTRQSMISFNTPAVLNCHGWKLAEYLCLGKCILSTPLSRLLPAPLCHEKHIFYTDGTIESIRAAIQWLQKRPDFRHRMEQNARQYFLAHLAPFQVIRTIVSGGN